VVWPEQKAIGQSVPRKGPNAEWQNRNIPVIITVQEEPSKVVHLKIYGKNKRRLADPNISRLKAVPLKRYIEAHRGKRAPEAAASIRANPLNVLMATAMVHTQGQAVGVTVHARQHALRRAAEANHLRARQGRPGLTEDKDRK